jgi:hypothetical protein
MDTRIEGTAPDQRLAIRFDITEGPYAGFYMDKYRAAKARGSDYEIKYKGIIKIRIPNPANKNARYPESDVNRFNDMIYRFQQSNEGFIWNGDETRLQGLTIGISVQEDEYNGNKFTKPVRFEIASEVRNGMVSVIPPKNREAENPTTGPMMDQTSGMQVVSTEQLPWDVS